MQGSIFVFIPLFWTLSEGIHIRFAVGLIFVYLGPWRVCIAAGILGKCHRKIILIEGNANVVI